MLLQISKNLISIIIHVIYWAHRFSLLWVREPLHAQRDMKGCFWTQHLQGTLQSFLHRQMASSGRSLEIVGVVMNTGSGALSGVICCHPHWLGEIGLVDFTRALPHTCPLWKQLIWVTFNLTPDRNRYGLKHIICPTWYATRKSCCLYASLLDVILSFVKVFPLWRKRESRAASTLATSSETPYSFITNLWNMVAFCSSTSWVMVGFESCWRGKVSSGRFCQTAHADILPFSKNVDVVSHQVMAWKAGRAIALDGPSLWAMACTGMNLQRL